MKRAAPIALLKAALSVPVAAITDPVAEVGLRTWIARLRTDRVAIFRASVSKTSNAAVVVEDLAAVIASAAAVASVAVIALADSAAVAAAALAGVAAGDEN